MLYCTNCGTKIENNSKFCQNCGTKIAASSDKIKRSPPPKRKMQKGVVKSLQSETENFVKSKIEKSVTPKIPRENPKIAEKVSEIDVSNKATTPGKDIAKKVRKWMLYYVLINIPLYFINTGDDEILGILIFSTIVFIGFLMYSFQKEKGKPYTIILKIILVLQSLLAVSGIMQRLEYISGIYSLVAVISLALLVFINIKIIFKRNK